MSLLPFVALLLLVAISLAPLWLLRNAREGQELPPSVLSNSAIALGLRVAVLAPFFWFGAEGAFSAVLIAAVSFLAGVAALAAGRRRILAFMNEAAATGRSVSPAGFLGGALLRPAAALIALILLALLALEATLAFDILAAALGTAGAASTVAVLLAVGLAAVWRSGEAAPMQAMQLQLGICYLGLFGAAMLLVYLKMAAVAAPSSQGILGVGAVAALALALILYRRNKYVETKAVRRSDVAPEALPRSELRGSRMLGGFVKTLNRVLTTLLVVAIVFAGMQLYFSGDWPALNASRGDPVSAAALVGVAALCFLAPILDPSNWQRMAIVAQRGGTDRETLAATRRAVAIYAVETPLVWVFVAMLGAVAATSGWGTAAGVSDYVAYLVAQEHAIASAALWFITLAVVATALSSMIGTLQALFWTARQDLWRRRA